jgi:hypothetical protein
VNEDYVRLYNEFIAAVLEAGAVLEACGGKMDSPEFLAADTKATALYAKLQQMRNPG